MRNVNLLLYLNLAGEVFYIIVHRMKSQKVKEEYQERVRNDIALAICHTTVIQNVLKGSLQILNLKLNDIRILMDRIVHSSIMTVNTFSMEKLFELTLIATKYQYTTCQYPSDILLVALNHLDSIRKQITDPAAITLAENLHVLLVDRFKDVDIRTMQTYRYLVLSYLADVKLKMTNLIRLRLQNTSGEFKKQFPDEAHRSELRRPGLIQVYKSGKEEENLTVVCNNKCESQCECDKFEDEDCLRALHLDKNHIFEEVLEPDRSAKVVYTTRFLAQNSGITDNVLHTSLALTDKRGIVLGLSIYDIPGNCDEDEGVENTDIVNKKETPGISSTQRVYTENAGSYSIPDVHPTKGLDLCSVLLGCDPTKAPPYNNRHNSVECSETSYGISASALGMESVLNNCQSFGFQNENTIMDSNLVNVIKFDGRQLGSTGSKATLEAIAQEFFALEATEKTGPSQHYTSAMDDLLEHLDISDPDETESGQKTKNPFT